MFWCPPQALENQAIACDHRRIPFDGPKEVSLDGAIFHVDAEIMRLVMPGLVADDEDWASQIPTLIAYGTLALVTFMAQGRTIMVRMAM